MSDRAGSRAAVCFIASDGYLFQTFVAATQAKSRLSTDADVVVVRIGNDATVEGDRFAQVARDAGIRMVEGDPSVIGDLTPTFARLFLDVYLPEYDQFIYLDGDTQITGDLAELISHPVEDGFAAVRDPMVPIRMISPRLGRKIDSWWDESEIPASLRSDYVNAGVFRSSAAKLSSIRRRSLELMQTRTAPYKFLDQDLINLALAGHLTPLSARWNYPGFLLGTETDDAVDPVVIHFMSNPRPWEGPYAPWGSEHFLPYKQFAADHPVVARYWTRADSRTRVKYTIQQFIKSVTERRLWNSRKGREAFGDWARGALAGR